MRWLYLAIWFPALPGLMLDDAAETDQAAPDAFQAAGGGMLNYLVRQVVAFRIKERAGVRERRIGFDGKG